MIKQIHVIECDSTQDLLKEQLNNSPSSESILLSCEQQSSGRGRNDKKWTSLPGSICFSMTILPHPELSFTALELSVLVTRFFEERNRSLQLKWPNDILDENSKKCAGILIQNTQINTIGGIGINLFSNNEAYGGVYPEEFVHSKKEWANDLAQYILKNRYSKAQSLKKHWLQRCGHLNQMVKITEGNSVYEGIFQGIGNYGEAEICVDSKVIRIFNGTLRMIY